MENKNKIITYVYKFGFRDGTEKEFRIKIDSRSLELIPERERDLPEWTELHFSQCPNCPLDEEKSRFCPVAGNIAEVVDFFKGMFSYEEVDVSIETEARTYFKHTSVQNGLSSMIGIYMVTSGCPVMEKLKPMVRYHLPFATEEETKYRALSMYLLAQYFRSKHKKEPDWELKKLTDIYDDVRTVNRAFCQRLSSIKIKDAGVNALVILDCFASFVLFSINREMIDEVENLFEAYFR